MTPAAALQPHELIAHVVVRLRARAFIETEAARLSAIAAAQEGEAHDLVSALFDRETADMALGFARRATDLSAAGPADVMNVPGLLARVLPTWCARDAIVLPTVPVGGGEPSHDPHPPASPDLAPRAPASSAASGYAPAVVAAATLPPVETPLGPSAVALAPATPAGVGSTPPSGDQPPDARAAADAPPPVPAQAARAFAAVAPEAPLTDHVGAAPSRPAPAPAPVPSALVRATVSASVAVPDDVPATDAETVPADGPASDPRRFGMDDMRRLRPKGTPVRPRKPLPTVPNARKGEFTFLGASVPATKRAELVEVINDALFVAQSDRIELCVLYDNNLGKAVWRRQVFRTVIEHETGCLLPKPESRNRTACVTEARTDRETLGETAQAGDPPHRSGPEGYDASVGAWTSESPTVAAGEAPSRQTSDDAPGRPVTPFAADAPARVDAVPPLASLPSSVAPASEEGTSVMGPASEADHDDEEDWQDPDATRIHGHDPRDWEDRGTREVVKRDEVDEEADMDPYGSDHDGPDHDDVAPPAPPRPVPPVHADVREPTLFSQLGHARDDRYGPNARLREPTIVSGAPVEVAEMFDRILESDDVGAAIDAMLAGDGGPDVASVPGRTPVTPVDAPVPPEPGTLPSRATRPGIGRLSSRIGVLRAPVAEVPDFMVDGEQVPLSPEVPHDSWDDPVATVRPYVRKAGDPEAAQVRVLPPPFEVGPIDKGLRYAPNFARAFEMARNGEPFAPPPPMTS